MPPIRAAVSGAVLLAVALAATRTAQSQSSPGRGFLLFRLAGRSGKACLSCHDAMSVPAATDAFRKHVDEQFGAAGNDDIAELKQYLAELRAESAKGTHTERDDLATSMRSLGYLDYQHGESLPDLGERLSLNAYELSSGATGATTLAADPKSPTRQALRIVDAAATGVVVGPYRITPGTYRVTLRTTAELPPVAARFLVIAKDKSRRDVALQTSEGGRDATATFEIERATPATFSLTPAGGATLAVTKLEIEKTR